MDHQQQQRYPVIFLMLYALTYMTNAVFGTFIPVYLNQIGFSRTIIGSLLAIGPMVAVVSQPIWGIAGDRASSKNLILKILLFGAAAAVLLFPLSVSWMWLVLILAVFTFFQSSVNPLSDAITLEYLESHRWHFGPIRLAGTIGFACMSLLVGRLVEWNIRIIFPLYSLIALGGFFVMFRIPVVHGHRKTGQKAAPWTLLKNKPVMLLIAFNFLIQVTLGFYYSFFPIYFTSLGGSSTQLGLTMLITSASEIPFLLLADKIIRKLGIPLTLFFSALIISLRWLLLHFVTNLTAIMAINAMHGLSFIVFAYCLAVFISKNVPNELKASGQTMNALLGLGLARLTGSMLGGLLSDRIGIRQAFLWTSLLGFASAAAFGSIFLLLDRRKNQTAQM